MAEAQSGWASPAGLLESAVEFAPRAAGEARVRTPSGKRVSTPATGDGSTTFSASANGARLSALAGRRAAAPRTAFASVYASRPSVLERSPAHFPSLSGVARRPTEPSSLFSAPRDTLQTHSSLDSNALRARRSAQGAQRPGSAADASLLFASRASAPDGHAVLVDVCALSPRVVSRRTTVGDARVLREFARPGQRRASAEPPAARRAPTIERVRREKRVELLRENPVAVERFVDVVRNVFIDVPIERTLEREVITETVVERAIEKTVEVTVEQLFEVLVERVVEVPREVRREVRVPFERVVYAPYDVFRENVVYDERVIDVDEAELHAYPHARVLPTVVDRAESTRVVEVPVVVEREVAAPPRPPVPVERTVVVARKVPVPVARPVPVERVVERAVDVAVERETRRAVELRVEVPVERERALPATVRCERLRELTRLLPVALTVERPAPAEREVRAAREFLDLRPVAREELHEVPVERFTEVGVVVERAQSVPVEKVVRRQLPRVRRVEAPFEQLVERTRLVERPRRLTVPVNRYHMRPRELLVEVKVPVERETQAPRVVERVRELPVRIEREEVQLRERLTLVDKPVEVLLECAVERLVVSDVHVRVEKEVRVPLTVQVERPVLRYFDTEEPLPVELHTTEAGESYTQVSLHEREDEGLAAEILERGRELELSRAENAQLAVEAVRLAAELYRLQEVPFAVQAETFDLRNRLGGLAAHLALARENGERLRGMARRAQTATETVLRVDPRVKTLRSRFRNLVDENRALVEEALSRGRQVERILGRAAL